MWWLALRGVAKKIPWKVWAFAGVLVAFWSWGEYNYHKGGQEVKAQWDAARKTAQSTVGQLAKDQKKISQEVKIVYVDRVKYIHEKAQVITKLVPQYIPADSCDLPGGFRVLHNAAVSNSIPEAPGGADDVPVTAREVATTVTHNYEVCNKNAAQLISLEAWADQQWRRYLELCKQPGVVCNKDN